MSNHKPKHQIIKRISFYGDAQLEKSDPVYQSAYEAAKLLAKEGYVIVNGGGPGVMDASTQGAESVDGETIAVTFSPKDAASFEGRYLSNLNIVDKEVVTTNYVERMFKLLEYGDLFVIFKGGSGTISEFGTAWVLANIYYGHHKPFILFGDFWREIVEVLQKNMNVDKQEMSCFTVVENKEELLEAIQHLEWKMAQIDHTHCRVCAEKAFMT